MSDLGSDAGQSTLSLTAKILEAILSLIEKIIERATDPQRKKAKVELEHLKDMRNREKIVAKLNMKAGYVNLKELQKSGEPLDYNHIKLTKEESARFSELCERNHVVFSGLTPKKDKNGQEKTDRFGRKDYHVVFMLKDAERIKEVLDQMNDEKRIDGIDKSISEIIIKAGKEGRELTEQEKVDIAAMEKEKRSIQQKYCDELNEEMSDAIIQEAVTGENQKKMTLDEALNRCTGGKLDKDIFTIVADASDPSKYIKCHSYQDIYQGKPYPKTEYEVYRDSKCVLKTHDGRFDGRPSGYWGMVKENIQKAGEFGDTFFKFSSIKDYQEWAKALTKENDQELGSMEKEGDRDISAIIKKLEDQLAANGGALKDGVVVDAQAGTPVVLVEGMDDKQRTLVAESLIIGRQIVNYQELQKLESELSLANYKVMNTEEGTPERAEAEAKQADVQARYDKTLETEQELITARKEVNGVQKYQENHDEMERFVDQEIEYLPEDKAQIEDLERKISEEKNRTFDLNHEAASTEDPEIRGDLNNRVDESNAKVLSMERELSGLKAQAVENAMNVEHPDERRGDRVTEHDPRQKNMAEYKGRIATERAKEGAKTGDVKDRQVHNLGAKAAEKVSKSMSHGDR